VPGVRRRRFQHKRQCRCLYSLGDLRRWDLRVECTLRDRGSRLLGLRDRKIQRLSECSGVRRLDHVQCRFLREQHAVVHR
jgi:hypothetical protein